ncbi:MAG: glutaminyl-peptide cyclotransferase [Chloroflexota bacterium]|nr:glutaminyl-peptide cyclotransferase [Chloroflexota bacterium]
MKRSITLLLLSIALLLPACGARAATQGVASPTVDVPAPTEPPTDTFQVLNHWPHDPTAYTEGLIYADGAFFESTGLNGMSSLRKVDAETGQVIASLPLDPEYFGEGLTLFNDTLIQLTWQSHIGFVYGLTCFCLERTFAYDGEGWGLTHDDRFLIMSDGTATIRFLDPDTFAVVRTISVTDHGTPLTNINELEYVSGEIYANIWLTNRIVRIDPTAGAILGWIDLTGLLPAADRSPSVNELNGIAYDDTTDRLFVTGKNWPEIFQITLVPE